MSGRTLHAATASVWLLFLAQIAWEIAATGNLHRSACEAGQYDTSFVVFMLLLILATALSSLRAIWVATPSDRSAA